VLKYWGPNGYFFTPIYCEHGSQISVTTGRTWGDPSAYEYTRFSFKAESSGPDSCQLIAWLQNTGSPPVSVINLYIKK
jgi:hypothetical protein